jgi:hypothetical protein
MFCSLVRVMAAPNVATGRTVARAHSHLCEESHTWRRAGRGATGVWSDQINQLQVRRRDRLRAVISLCVVRVALPIWQICRERIPVSGSAEGELRSKNGKLNQRFPSIVTIHISDRRR